MSNNKTIEQFLSERAVYLLPLTLEAVQDMVYELACEQYDGCQKCQCANKALYIEYRDGFSGYEFNFTAFIGNNKVEEDYFITTDDHLVCFYYVSNFQSSSLIYKLINLSTKKYHIECSNCGLIHLLDEDIVNHLCSDCVTAESEHFKNSQ